MTTKVQLSIFRIFIQSIIDSFCEYLMWMNKKMKETLQAKYHYE